MNHDHYPDTYLRNILHQTKTIALVGASDKSSRPSHRVMQYLLDKGYQVIPINPGKAGQKILGQIVYASLADVPEAIDMIDVFRNSAAAGQVVDQALALRPLPSVIWMQLEVRNDEAASKAEATGVKMVMNRCPKIEYQRLISD